ncbi:MAG TPA: hypothetical protein VI278_10360 [Nitrososphaeraceae archaeon]
MMWLELVSVLLHCRDSISTRFMSLQTSYTQGVVCPLGEDESSNQEEPPGSRDLGGS